MIDDAPNYDLDSIAKSCGNRPSETLAAQVKFDSQVTDTFTTRPCYRASQIGLSNFTTAHRRLTLHRISLQQLNANVNTAARLTGKGGSAYTRLK
jgi:hypothetical protein